MNNLDHFELLTTNVDLTYNLAVDSFTSSINLFNYLFRVASNNKPSEVQIGCEGKSLQTCHCFKRSGVITNVNDACGRAKVNSLGVSVHGGRHTLATVLGYSSIYINFNLTFHWWDALWHLH